jgi:hypothetical protein
MNSEQITLVVGLGIVVLGAIVWAFKKPENSAQNVIKIPGGFEFALNTPAIATMAIGVVLVVVSRTLPGPPDLPIQPDLPIKSDKPPTHPESLTTLVKSFTVKIPQPPAGDTGLRVWLRKGNSWEEKEPNGNVNIHKIEGRISFNECDGVKSKKENDPNLEFFVPESDCAWKMVQFRRNGGLWAAWLPMSKINESD